MGFVTKFLKQDAVLWRNPVKDKFLKVTFDAGEEIKVRWEDKMIKIVDKNMEYISQAEILVDTDIELGEYLYLGTLDSLSAGQQANPLLVENAYEVISKSKIPNVRATDFVRKVWVHDAKRS